MSFQEKQAQEHIHSLDRMVEAQFENEEPKYEYVCQDCDDDLTIEQAHILESIEVVLCSGCHENRINKIYE